MKFIDEYRNPQAVKTLARDIRRLTTQPWTIMEICGGQTHAIVKYGLDTLLPPEITLLHGPGCPVCVTAAASIDTAIELAGRDEIILCSFGDMMRVPGSRRDLLSAKAGGADIRTVYSPLDAVKIAQDNPEKDTVFFAIGFETTAPANAMAVLQAKQAGLDNFTLLTAQVLVPPAIEAILSAPDCRIQGFLLAGHVCAVMGYAEYEPLASRYGAPMAVTGFEPVDILLGIRETIAMLEGGDVAVQNHYGRSVRREGNQPAMAAMREVFVPVDREWRGIGMIPRSGLGLNQSYSVFDAERKFRLHRIADPKSSDCISGQILQGKGKPTDCPVFGTLCTPEHPLGATMVSSEGACAAYHKYRSQPVPPPAAEENSHE
jgi:hydrogenase expression/formation protein HypD